MRRKWGEVLRLRPPSAHPHKSVESASVPSQAEAAVGFDIDLGYYCSDALCTTHYCAMVFGTMCLVLEPTTDQIQEAISEAVNNIVKHFHKPEKEVCVYVCVTLM